MSDDERTDWFPPGEEPIVERPDGLTQYERAHLNLLAGIEHQLTRIADGNAESDVHLAYEQVQEAWKAELPIYEDKAVPILQRLGITVD